MSVEEKSMLGLALFGTKYTISNSTLIRRGSTTRKVQKVLPVCKKNFSICEKSSHRCSIRSERRGIYNTTQAVYYLHSTNYKS